MSILVSGGAGYIGSHTCVELAEAGYDVVIADNLVNSSEEAVRRVRKLTGKDIPFIKAELCDPKDVERVFAEHPDIDSIIHFAGLKAVGESVRKPLEYYTNNLVNTLMILNEMRRRGVKNFVFSSSATVYGEPDRMPISEEFPTGGTTNPYGTTKLMIERILTDCCAADPGLNVALLRYFNPIGAHPSGIIGEDPNGIPNNLVPYIAQVAVGKLEKLHVYGNDYPTHDGTGVRDYIHVVDLAKGHVAAAAYAQTHTGVEIINLGTGTGYSVLDIVHTFERVNGVKVPYQIVPRRPGDIAECWADPKKATELLGWQAEKTLEDMCRDSWRWQTQNPNGYAD